MESLPDEESPGARIVETQAVREVAPLQLLLRRRGVEIAEAGQVAAQRLVETDRLRSLHRPRQFVVAGDQLAQETLADRGIVLAMDTFRRVAVEVEQEVRRRGFPLSSLRRVSGE